MNCLTKSKGKNIVAIVFTAFYTIILLLDIDFFKVPFFQSWRYAINSLLLYLFLITPVFVLVYLLTLNKEYAFKKWLFPIAFGVDFLHILLVFVSNLPTTLLYLYTYNNALLFICSCLMLVASLMMFIGTLFHFKCIALLRFGALSCLILLMVEWLLVCIPSGMFANISAYIQAMFSRISAINIAELIKAIAQMLFYVGIFILTTGRRNTNTV